MGDKKAFTAILLAILLPIVPLLLAYMAWDDARNVISEHIVDGTINSSDLAEKFDVNFKLPDGQILSGELFFGETSEQSADVLGLTDESGKKRVIVESDGLFVVEDSGTGSVEGESTGEGDTDTSTDTSNTFVSNTFNTGVFSINGVGGDGSNVNLVPGANIAVTPDAVSGGVQIDVVDGSGSGLDSDTLDGLNSTDFMLATTDNWVDTTGDTMTGNLVMDGSAIEILNGDLYGDSDSELDWYGDVYLGDSGKNVELYGNIYMNPDLFTWNDGDFLNSGDILNLGDFYNVGESYLYDNVYTYSSNYLFGNTQLGNSASDVLDFQGTITNTSGSNNGHVKIDDRLVVTESIGSGEPGALLIKDNDGLFVETYGSSTPLWGVDGSGVATFYGNALPAVDLTYDLGSAAQRWNNVYAGNIVATDLTVDTLTVLTESFHYGDEHYYADIDAQGRIVNTAGNVFIDDRLNVSGTIGSGVAGTALTVKDNDGFLVQDWSLNELFSVQGDGQSYFGGNALPNVDLAYNLGSPALRWNELFAGTVNINDLIVNGISTHYGKETYLAEINAEGSIVNDAGEVLINDSARVTGSLVATNNVQLGDALSDNVQIRGTIRNGTSGDSNWVIINDRLHVTNGIGTGDPNQLLIKDEDGLLVETWNGGGNGVDLLDVRGNGDIFTGLVTGRSVLSVNASTDDGAGNAVSSGGNYEVTIDGDLLVTGELSLAGAEITGDLTINGQLTVNDLVVNNNASIGGAITSNLEPLNSGTNDLGTAVYRWRNLFVENVDASGTITVGTLTVGGIANVETAINDLNTAVGTLTTDLTNLTGRVDALELLPVSQGGVDLTAQVVPGAGFVDYVVNTSSAMQSISVSPIGNANLRLQLMGNPQGSASVTVRVYGPAGSTVDGISWVAVLQ